MNLRQARDGGFMTFSKTTRKFRFFLAVSPVVLLSGCVATDMDRAQQIMRLSDRGGVEIEYDFAQAAVQIPLDPEEAFSDGAALEVLNEGPILIERTFESALPIERLTIRLSPDTRSANGQFPTLVQVAEQGYVLYLPALRTEMVPGDPVFELPEDIVTHPSQNRNGFVFIGPKGLVRDSAFGHLIASPSTPMTIVDDIIARSESILAFFTDALKRPPPDGPTIIIDYDTEGPSNFVGHVAQNSTILLQFNEGALDIDAFTEEILPQYLTHEFFHLWNGKVDIDHDGPNLAWMHEGAAEYASWVAAISLFDHGKSLEHRVEQQLGLCTGSLGNDALLRLEDQRRDSSRYSCGSVIAWLSDVADRSHGGSGIFGFWGEILDSGEPYGFEDFNAALNRRPGPAADAIDAILSRSDPKRWNDVFAALSTIGVIVRPAVPGPEAVRSAAIHTLLREGCSRSAGFETVGMSERPDRIILRTEAMEEAGDAPGTCDALGGDPELVSVAGFSVLGDWTHIANVISEACASRADISLTLRRGGQLVAETIRCKQPAEAPEPRLEVVKALPD